MGEQGIMNGHQFYDDRRALCTLISSLCAPGCIVSMYSIAWIAISRWGTYYFTFYCLCVDDMLEKLKISKISSVF
uniref:Uncharacterized protein n=1 Tax=Romanomermis culicivorax TaxID=13658 RepID=A0A915IK07_ROMCU